MPFPSHLPTDNIKSLPKLAHCTVSIIYGIFSSVQLKHELIASLAITGVCHLGSLGTDVSADTGWNRFKTCSLMCCRCWSSGKLP